MSVTRIRVDLDDPGTFPKGKVDFDALDRTSESDIAWQKLQDDADAARDALRHARRRLDVGEAEFAMRLGISRSTLRDWERGVLDPAKAATALQAALAGETRSERTTELPQP